MRRRIGLTFGGVLVACVALYLVTDLWLGMGDEHAKTIAGIPLLFSTQIFEAIDRGELKNDLARGMPERSVSLHAFGIRSVWAIILALLTTFALVEVVYDYMAIYFDLAKFGLDKFTFGYTPGDSFDNLGLVGFGGAAPLIIGTYLIGRWLGTRSRARMAVTVCCMTAVYALFRVFTGISIFYFGGGFAPGFDISPLTYAGGSIVSILLYAVVVSLGFWRGRRRRLGAYLQYLLSGIRDSDRATLVSLAEDEVFKARATAAG